MSNRTTRYSILLTLLTALLAWSPSHCHSQRKEISQVRTYLKSGKDYDKAENLLTGLLRNPANSDNPVILQLLYQTVEKQYESANERLYLKQKQDTAAFFLLVNRLFEIGESLDSLDARPDKKGKTKLTYRDEHSEQLNALRPNLFAGGRYHVRKGNYATAYDYFERYMDCATQPLFSKYDYKKTDPRISEAAYLSVYCGHMMNDAVKTLRYRQKALGDTAHAAYTLQYTAEAWKQINDDSLYVSTLREGFSRYPEYPYFFPRLIDYYSARRDYPSAMSIADSALAANDSSVFFLLAKSTLLFNTQDYERCIDYSDRLIQINDSLADAYYNAGSAWLNIALEQYDRREKKNIVRASYQKAREYMEHYRLMAPDNSTKWAPALYRIYFNLNMGRQFDEIDKILKKQK